MTLLEFILIVCDKGGEDRERADVYLSRLINTSGEKLGGGKKRGKELLSTKCCSSPLRKGGERGNRR